MESALWDASIFIFSPKRFFTSSLMYLYRIFKIMVESDVVFHL